VYEITDAGRAAPRAWLAAPELKPPEIEAEVVLRLM
jgi:hypothetical protein